MGHEALIYSNHINDIHLDGESLKIENHVPTDACMAHGYGYGPMASAGRIECRFVIVLCIVLTRCCAVADMQRHLHQLDILI